MKKILQVSSSNDYVRYVGAEVYHPHIGVIHYDELEHCRHSLNHYGVYGLFLLEDSPYSLAYGQGHYSFAAGSLLSVAPGQMGGVEDNGEIIHISGWALLFDQQLLAGTALEHRIKEYKFFSYYESEALRTEPEERRMLTGCFEMIRQELMLSKYDRRQKDILTLYLTLVLEYCARFYERQFRQYGCDDGDLLKRFSALLNEYYELGLQDKYGLPTVKYCAQKLCFSTGYFGEIVSQASGLTAAVYIRDFILQRAVKLLAAGKSVAETAQSLGFAYPQHFTRLFKNRCGLTPSAYISKLRMSGADALILSDWQQR